MLSRIPLHSALNESDTNQIKVLRNSLGGPNLFYFGTIKSAGRATTHMEALKRCTVKLGWRCNKCYLNCTSLHSTSLYFTTLHFMQCNVLQ